MSTSILTSEQVKTFNKIVRYDGERCLLTVTLRYDDQCRNGHNTFSITGELWRATKDGRRKGRDCLACGCLHDDIAKHFHELAHVIPWHGVTTDGPLLYIENTLYHMQRNGPNRAWIYYTGPRDPLGIGGDDERCLGYEKEAIARRVEGAPGYRVVWDTTTSKEANLEHARQCAVWPDATENDLLAPGLEDRLLARLPKLMQDFKATIEALGFTY